MEDKEYEKCQYHYWNLIYTRPNLPPLNPEDYIRILFQTQKCDKISNLEEHRNTYQKFFQKRGKEDSLKRLFEANYDYLNEKLAQAAVAEYQQWDQRDILKGLSKYNYAAYFATRFENVIIAFLGISIPIGVGRYATYHSKMKRKHYQEIFEKQQQNNNAK